MVSSLLIVYMISSRGRESSNNAEGLNEKSAVTVESKWYDIHQSILDQMLPIIPNELDS